MLRNRYRSTTFHAITTGDARGWCQNWLVWSTLVSRSHHTFRPVLTVKLLGIMLRSRCWPTTFHTITTRDADKWCQNWLVWSTRSRQTFCPVLTVKLLGLMLRIRCWRTISSHYIQPEMLMDGAKNGWCDQPLMPQSHHTFRPVLIVTLMEIMLRNNCWHTTFHTITTGDADGWCQKQLVWSTPHYSQLDTL